MSVVMYVLLHRVGVLNVVIKLAAEKRIHASSGLNYGTRDCVSISVCLQNMMEENH